MDTSNPATEDQKVILHVISPDSGNTFEERMSLEIGKLHALACVTTRCENEDREEEMMWLVPPGETPRLCRGGSRSLTAPEISK